jgi:hypothetical protein
MMLNLRAARAAALKMFFNTKNIISASDALSLLSAHNHELSPPIAFQIFID